VPAGSPDGGQFVPGNIEVLDRITAFVQHGAERTARAGAAPGAAVLVISGTIVLRRPAFIFLLLREVVWVILDQFRTAVFCCCFRCGHVGNALALSIMSTAMLGARAVDL